MARRTVAVLGRWLAGGLLGLTGPGAAAQAPRPPTDAASAFDTAEAPVLRVFSAEDGGHRFVAYLVSWKGSEVVVSDPLARSRFRPGDRIHFMAQKVSLGVPGGVATMNFTHGSPQMNSFGPNLQLAKDLLAKGETAVVLEYFERCGRFWKMGTERLAAWAESVRQGRTPEFGANLDY